MAWRVIAQNIINKYFPQIKVSIKCLEHFELYTIYMQCYYLHVGVGIYIIHACWHNFEHIFLVRIMLVNNY